MRLIAVLVAIVALYLCYRLHRRWKRDDRVMKIVRDLRSSEYLLSPPPVLCMYDHEDAGFICVKLTRQSEFDRNQFYCVPTNLVHKENHGGCFVHVDDLVDML